MSLFPASTGGKLVFPPKMGGKSITVSLIGEIERIQSTNEKFNYKDKNQKDMGFYDVVPVLTDIQDEETGKVEETEIKMLVGTWKLYFALKEANEKDGVDVGTTIKIEHPSKGVYNITKV